MSHFDNVTEPRLYRPKNDNPPGRQQTFEEYMARQPRFNGADYQHGRDAERLTGQIKRVHAFMIDGRWHTLDAIASGTGDPHASVSAQLRHLRKPRFGGYTIEKRHLGNGLYEYRMTA